MFYHSISAVSTKQYRKAFYMSQLVSRLLLRTFNVTFDYFAPPIVNIRIRDKCVYSENIQGVDDFVVVVVGHCWGTNMHASV